MWVDGQLHAYGPLLPGKPGTHCVVGWVGPRVVLDGCGKFASTEIRSQDRPARSAVSRYTD